MRLLAIVVLLAASFCFAQEQGDFKPATSNVLDAQYPKVDSNSRVQIRFKAPDAAKVKLNFWSGPKLDMEKAAGRVLDRYHSAHGPGASLLHRHRGWRRGERSGQHGLLRRQQVGQRGRGARSRSGLLPAQGCSARAGARGLVSLQRDRDLAARVGLPAAGL